MIVSFRLLLHFAHLLESAVCGLDNIDILFLSYAEHRSFLAATAAIIAHLCLQSLAVFYAGSNAPCIIYFRFPSSSVLQPWFFLLG